MKKTTVALGFLAITTLALTGSGCAKEDKMDDDMNQTDSMMQEESSMNDTSKDMMDDSSMVAEPMEDGEYMLVVDESVLEYEGKKVTGSHAGTIMLKSGTITFANGMPTTGEFVVDMPTLECCSLDDQADFTAVENHLKSDDFFDVENHPEATFTATSFTQINENNYTVSGDLTIKGITHPLEFNAQIMNKGEGMVQAMATATVERTQYDIKFRSLKFFSDVADNAIDDNFTVELNVVAKKN